MLVRKCHSCKIGVGKEVARGGAEVHRRALLAHLQPPGATGLVSRRRPDQCAAADATLALQPLPFGPGPVGYGGAVPQVAVGDVDEFGDF